MSGEQPWLDKRESETEEQYDTRMGLTCEKCGAFPMPGIVLVLHRQECRGPEADVTRWHINE